MGMEHWWNDTDMGKPEVLGERHFVVWVVGE